MNGMTRIGWVCAAIFFAVAAPAQPLPDARSLLERMKARMELVYNDSKTNRFSYTRTNVLEELDAKDQIRKRSVKTYHVLLVQGLPKARTIAVDGRALSKSEQRVHHAEEQRLQRTIAQDKSPDWDKPKPWLTDDLLARFKFKVVARTNLENRVVLMMSFAPCDDAPSRNMVDRIINRISGVLFVDEEEAEIARLNLVINEPVKFWGGILGQLDRFEWTLQRRRSAMGVWFNQLSTGFIQIRKVLATTRFRFNEESFGFARDE